MKRLLVQGAFPSSPHKHPSHTRALWRRGARHQAQPAFPRTPDMHQRQIDPNRLLLGSAVSAIRRCLLDWQRTSEFRNPGWRCNCLVGVFVRRAAEQGRVACSCIFQQGKRLGRCRRNVLAAIGSRTTVLHVVHIGSVVSKG